MHLAVTHKEDTQKIVCMCIIMCELSTYVNLAGYYNKQEAKFLAG